MGALAIQPQEVPTTLMFALQCLMDGGLANTKGLFIIINLTAAQLTFFPLPDGSEDTNPKSVA